MNLTKINKIKRKSSNTFLVTTFIILIMITSIYHYYKYNNYQLNNIFAQQQKNENITFFPTNYKPNKFELCISTYYPNMRLNQVLPSGDKSLSLLKTIEYYADYYKAIELAELKTSCIAQTIIINLDNDQQGGHGDKVKGLINTFYISLLIGAKFQILYNLPTSMSNFFVPKYPEIWSFENSTKFQHLNRIYYTPYPNEFELRDFEKEFDLYDSLIVETTIKIDEWPYLKNNNNTKHRLNYLFPFLENQNRIEMGHVVAKLFFSEYTEDIKEKLLHLKLLKVNDGFKIGVQLRYGDRASGFSKDMPSEPAPDQASSFHSECFSNRTIEVCLNQTKKCDIFITSDYEQGIEQFKSMVKNSLKGKIDYEFYVNQGEIVHIMFVSQRPKDLVLKTYLDWIVLSKMDFLIISRSGYGETAAWISLADTKRPKQFTEDICRTGFYIESNKLKDELYYG